MLILNTITLTSITISQQLSYSYLSRYNPFSVAYFGSLPYFIPYIDATSTIVVITESSTISPN